MYPNMKKLLITVIAAVAFGACFEFNNVIFW